MEVMYMTIGVIASGKSTWARNAAEDDDNVAIINRDSMRTMIKGEYVYHPKYEKLIKENHFQMIHLFLKQGFEVIVDECHLTKEKRIATINEVEKRLGKPIEVCYVHSTLVGGNVDRRMKADARGYPREKWQDVYDGMMKSLEIPSVDEHPSVKEVIKIHKSRFEAYHG